MKYTAQAGTLHPKHVRVPAPLVDYAVVASSPEFHPQTAGGFDPALSGDLRIPLAAAKPPPLGGRAVVVRRAAMELVPGAVVNLGVGYPDAMGGLAADERVDEMVTLTNEPGTAGGQPGADLYASVTHVHDQLLHAAQAHQAAGWRWAVAPAG